MKKSKRLYFTWNEESADPDEHYWQQWDSLEDAVSEYGNIGVEVFTAELRSIGKFKRAVVNVRMKAKKKKAVKK